MIKKFKYPGAITVSYGEMFIEGSVASIKIALMSVYAVKFGKNLGDISILLTLSSVGILLSLFLSGMISDKTGRRAPIFLGNLLFTVFLFAFPLTDNFNVALVLWFIVGIAHGLTDTPSMSLLFDALAGNTGPAMSFVQVFFASGGIMASLMASAIIRYDLDYKIAFFAILVINLIIMTVIIKSRFPHTARVQSAASVRPYIYKREPSIMREGVLLLLCTLLFSFYSGIFSTWLPTYMETVKGFTSASAVAMLSVNQGGAMIGALCFAIVLRKIHTTVLMALNPLAAVVLFALLLLSSQHWLLYGIVLFIGFFMGLFFSLAINMGGELFFEHAGTATGAVGTTTMIGSTVMVFLTGRLIESVGIGRLFPLSFYALLVLVVLTFIFRHNYKTLEPSKGVR